MFSRLFLSPIATRASSLCVAPVADALVEAKRTLKRSLIFDSSPSSGVLKSEKKRRKTGSRFSEGSRFMEGSVNKAQPGKSSALASGLVVRQRAVSTPNLAIITPTPVRSKITLAKNGLVGKLNGALPGVGALVRPKSVSVCRDHIPVLVVSYSDDET